MRVVGLTLALLGGLGCGAPSPRVFSPPAGKPMVGSASPTPPHPARWLELPTFTTTALTPELSDFTQLLVNAEGRRLHLRPDGFSEADVLAPVPLVAVRTTTKGFRFFGEDGALLESETALGPFTTFTRGALPIGAAPSVGAHAAMAVAPDGTVLRSVDGAPFEVVSKQALGVPAWATPRAVVLDPAGHGALLALPQRLFWTEDDGKTWKRAVPDDRGVAELGVAVGGAVLARGIVPTEPYLLGFAFGKPATPLEPSTIGSQRPPRRAGVLEDAVVLFDDGQLDVHRADGFRVTTKLTGPGAKLEHIGGSSALLVGLAPGRVVLSRDGGTSFTESHPWSVQELGARPRVRVDGGAVVIADCNAVCTGVIAKSAEGPFHAVTPPAGAQIVDVALRQGTLWLLTRVNAMTLELSSGPVGEAATTKIRTLVLDHPDPLDLWVDDVGTVRALVREGGRTTLLRVAPDGALLPPVQHPTFRAASVRGLRGLAFTEPGRLAETADGGEHWHQVGGPGTSHVVCGPVGCAVGPVGRLGWDLPGFGEPLAASPAPAPKAPTTPRVATCETVTDKATTRTLGEGAVVQPVLVPGGLRTAIATTDAAQGVTLELFGGAASKPRPLAPKVKLGKQAFLGDMLQDTDADGLVVSTKIGAVRGGIVVARARFPAGKKGSIHLPVRLELFWWSARTDAIHAVDLGVIAPFRIALRTPGLDVSAAIAGDDGLLVQPDEATTAWLVPTKGAPTMLPFPAKAWLRGAARVAGTVRFVGGTSAGTLVGAASADRVHVFGWAFAEPPQLVTLGGLPYLASETALFPIEELGPEVPDPVPRLSGSGACTGPLDVGAVVVDRRIEEVVVDGDVARTVEVHTQLDAKGKGCVAARRLLSIQTTAWVAGVKGFAIRGSELTSLACKSL